MEQKNQFLPYELRIISKLKMGEKKDKKTKKNINK